MIASRILPPDHDDGGIDQVGLALDGWQTPGREWAARMGPRQRAGDTNSALHNEPSPATSRTREPWQWANDVWVAGLWISVPAFLAALVAAKVPEPFGVRE